MLPFNILRMSVITKEVDKMKVSKTKYPGAPGTDNN